MQGGRGLSIKAAIYTMIKRWKLMLIIFSVMFAGSCGYLLYKNHKVENKSETDSKINTVDDNVDIRSYSAYKEYNDKAAYMKLNPDNLYIHRIIYACYESDEPAISDLRAVLSNRFQTKEFNSIVSSYNEKYYNMWMKELLEVRYDSRYIIVDFFHSENDYVDDLANAIKKYVISIVGDNKDIKELTAIFEGDILTTGEIVRGNQNYRIKQLERLSETAQESVTKEQSGVDKGIARQFSGRKGVLMCFALSLISSFLIGLIIVIFGKKIYTIEDTYDLCDPGFLCMVRGSNTSWLDRVFYNKNDRFKNPYLYISMLEKRISDAGINNTYILSCTKRDQPKLESVINRALDNVEHAFVTKESFNELYMSIKDYEAVVLFVKGGDSYRRELTAIRENIDLFGIKCMGVIFGV